MSTRRSSVTRSTTCISYEEPGIEDAELSRALDVASGNAYYEMQDSLAHPSARPRSTGSLGWVVRGPWAVTQLAWLLIARGARVIEYWQWNTLPFGTETYWGGVLPHSGIPGRAYREIARIGAELRAAGSAFAAAEPDYDVAVLCDSDSKFALSVQGPLRGDDLVDPDSYRHILAAFARGAFDGKRQQRLVRPRQLLPSRGGAGDAAGAAARYPVLIAAAFYTAADADLDFLVDYARAVTTKSVAAGRITVIGTVPDQDLAAGLIRWLTPQAVGGWTVGDSVTSLHEYRRELRYPAARPAQLELG